MSDGERRFTPAVSIIINTDARLESLKLTLASLRHLDYPRFEVCVVYGPTRDGTAEFLEQWRPRVKVAHCPARNLSQSRNIGIGISAGEIVAFLDDDSIPEPEWLSRVVEDFRDPNVAACGGFLRDPTGVGLQWRFGTINRLCRQDQNWNHPPVEFNFPFTSQFTHLMANSAFRKSAVLAFGGFDEQYEYYADEADLICRMIDSGWRISQIVGADVHHKFRPSHIRSQGVVLSWYAIVRSKIYFSLVNCHGHHTVATALEDALAFVKEFRDNLEWGIRLGRAVEADRARFDEEVDRALRDGLTIGFARARRLRSAESLGSSEQPFLAFPILTPPQERKTFCFLSRTYPPGSIGGIARYIHQLARSIAMMGHQVHVLTQSSADHTVDFEDGVWVHRLPPGQPGHGAPPPQGVSVPAHIWAYSAAMLDEVRRIGEQRRVDAVYAPIWDCEGLAVLLDGKVPVVTSLQTTLDFWLESHPHMRTDADFMDNFVQPMLVLEKMMMQRSTKIHTISKAITREIEDSYHLKFEPARLDMVPLGLEDWTLQRSTAPERLPEGTLRVLFVGRLERRKGIDVLLEVCPRILSRFPHVHVDIVGADIPFGGNESYRTAFEAEQAGNSIGRRVAFHGEVGEEALRGFYRACDIFVAPSRFESFGLILIEAMMFAKPVIGCRAGGMVEVVDDGVTGLLAEPGDASSLEACLVRLIESEDLRRRLGAAARKRYEDMFTPEHMVAGVLELLCSLSDRSEPAALRAAV